jgi:hypothetical protein
MSDVVEIEVAAGRLLVLAAALDEPVENADYPLALVALGQRARSLMHGALILLDSDAPAGQSVFVA